MTVATSQIVESYLSRLRSELTAVGAADTDDLVAEIRSLLTDAAGDDPASAGMELGRLGEPDELARGILAERGLDASKGMSSGVWWRLGIAAPVDIAIGLALPLAAALLLYVVAWFGQPRVASVAIAIALGAVALAWPFLVWRPWRRGGRALSPGMTLTGLAVVRAPGFWRLVRIEDLRAMGLAPRRRMTFAVVLALIAVVLLAGASLTGLDIGRSWLAEAAVAAESAGRTGGGPPLGTQLQTVAEQVYAGLESAPGPDQNSAMRYVTPDAPSGLARLWERIAKERIHAVRIGALVQVGVGVYRFEVEESREDGSGRLERVGSSTFTVGRRRWLREGGVGTDWAVVGIEAGTALGRK